jgi:hypothetical protein
MLRAIHVELRSQHALLDTLHLVSVALEPTVLRRNGRQVVKAVRMVGCPILLGKHLHVTVPVVGHEGADWSVHGNVAKVDTQT